MRRRRPLPAIDDETARQAAFRHATVQPDRRMPAPTPEDWAQWAEHPITQWVAARYLAQARLCRDTWMAESWGSGIADQATLADFRTRADCYAAFYQTPLDQFLIWEANEPGKD